jgi:hypothetical protein
LDHGHDGSQTPLHVGQLGLDGLLLAHDVLQLAVGLGGLEVGDLAFILLDPETLAFADGTLCVAVWVTSAPGLTRWAGMLEDWSDPVRVRARVRTRAGFGPHSRTVSSLPLELLRGEVGHAARAAAGLALFGRGTAIGAVWRVAIVTLCLLGCRC